MAIARRATPEDLKHIRPQFIGINSELSDAGSAKLHILKPFTVPSTTNTPRKRHEGFASVPATQLSHLHRQRVGGIPLTRGGGKSNPGKWRDRADDDSCSPAMLLDRYRIGDVGRYRDAIAPVASDTRCWRPSRAGPTIASFCRAGNLFLR